MSETYNKSDSFLCFYGSLLLVNFLQIYMSKSVRIFNYFCGAISRQSFKDNLFRNRLLYDQVLLYHSHNEARNFQNSTFKPTAANLLETFPTLCDELAFNLGLPLKNNSVLDHLRLVSSYFFVDCTL